MNWRSAKKTQEEAVGYWREFPNKKTPLDTGFLQNKFN